MQREELRRGRCDTRPVRIAFLVQDDEHSQFVLDGIFADCLGRWGGRFNLIIPCEHDMIPEPYWAWLAAYDPDVIYSYFSLADEVVLKLHERFGPSVYAEHQILTYDDVDCRNFRPKYGAKLLQSLSTIFRRARYRGHRSPAGPLQLIDAWHTEETSRFLADNFGTYHRSYGTSIYPADAHSAAQLLTIVNPDKQADGRFGVPRDLVTVPSELEAFKQFAHRRATSLSIASMDFAPKLDARSGNWGDSFNLVVGETYQDRVLFWNGRLLHHNWIGVDLGSFRVTMEMLDNDEFFSTLVTLLNSGSWGYPQ